MIFIVLFITGCASIAKTIKDNPKSFNQYNPDGTLKAGKITFVYIPDPGEKVDSVYIAGTFNQWNEGLPDYEFYRMENGNYKIELELPAGKYVYQYMINGNWLKYDAGTITGGMETITNKIAPLPDSFYKDCFGGPGVVIVLK
ncbi:MAG: hypothetical protein HPY53_11275 [Brevinematales bacterium]|nr:hypothetical protein [Brevinematales bacterium]